MNVWIALAIVLLILSVLAFVSSRNAQDTRPMFLWGFNAMGPVALVYCYFGAGDVSHKALILILVGLYLLRMNIVLTRWYGNTAASKLKEVMPTQQVPWLAVMMVNIFGWLYCLPFYWGSQLQGPWGLQQWLVIGFYLVGTCFHFGSDYQKRRFKQDPKNKGRILDVGFWSIARHPNYFGDFLIFVSFGLLAGNWFGIIAPLTNLVQYFADAIPKSEKMAEKRYGEAWLDYKRKVKCFIPFIF
ncbi:Predicted membrane protein [Serratia rubidaea]|nr:DUF1295 domain-containing protein [Serratia rubidaea]SQJ31239.1 Predicted membrane protein [Serratia rubidaea]